MDYLTMTKFELNKTLLLSTRPSMEADIIRGKVVLSDFGGAILITNIQNDSIRSTLMFDPCNNWNDVMPIAIDLGVNIQHMKNGNIYINKPDVMGMSFRLGGGFEMSPQQAIVVCCIEALLEDN